MNKKIVLLVVLLAFLLALSGCNRASAGTPTTKSKSTGTDGIVISFVPGNPQDKYTVSELSEPISVILEVRNKGTWPQGRDETSYNNLKDGMIYLSGFDKNILSIEPYYQHLRQEFLPGLGLINPDGGFDTTEFKGIIISSDIIIDSYDPTILATACFPYVTKASPAICIDPKPFDTTRRKVCTIGTTSLSSQGAPIAVTKIEQEASSTKTQFKISIKNAGKGDVMIQERLPACDPRGFGGEKLERKDFDRVEFVRASVGTVQLICDPLVDGRYIQLYNGEGFVICSLSVNEYDGAQDAYKTPLNIELRYGYRTTASKPIRITKITGIR